MTELKNIIALNIKRYPRMEMQDLLKIVYQNEFGPGHLIEDGTASFQHLVEEWELIKKREDTALPYGAYEKLGNGLCRANLAAYQYEHLPLLNNAFVVTAQMIKGCEERFLEKLSRLPEYCRENRADFSEKKVAAFLAQHEYKSDDIPRHSMSYHKFYRPAYRVISLYELDKVLYGE